MLGAFLAYRVVPVLGGVWEILACLGKICATQSLMNCVKATLNAAFKTVNAFPRLRYQLRGPGFGSL